MLEENGLDSKDIIRHCKIYDYEGNKKYWNEYSKRLHRDVVDLGWVWSESEGMWIYEEDIEWSWKCKQYIRNGKGTY